MRSEPETSKLYPSPVCPGQSMAPVRFTALKMALAMGSQQHGRLMGQVRWTAPAGVFVL
jgi:hypothetical protein